MIYLYGVMSGPADLPVLAGLEEARVETLELEGLVLAVSRLDDGAPTLSDDAVLRHAEVVEALMRTGVAVLPARFGLAFEDEAALERSVRERREELGEALGRVRGCVELGLRVLAPEPDESADTAVTGGD